MVDAVENKDHYLRQFEERAKRSAGCNAEWLRILRREAVIRFAQLGFPTTRDEEWRFTNVAPIARSQFQLYEDGELDVPRAWLDMFSLGEKVDRLVFVHGRYAPSLSSLHEPPHGVHILDLATAMTESAELVEPHLSRYARYESHAFTALNTAFIDDGAFIHIPDGVIVETPIHLLFVGSSSGKGAIAHPRNLVVVGNDAQVTLVETYVGFGKGTYFTNAVTELVVGDNAVVNHCKVESESETAFHVATLQLHQQRSSAVTSHTISLGGALVRNEINAVLDGEGCDCALNGLYVVAGSQHVDNHLTVDHASPHCTSREFFKGIIDDKARGVFSGRIIVRKDAQKTDAKQTNKSLLLSREAQVESKPQLEILADDVKCTHGATIGQLDKEALFYLRSRGLSKTMARNVLVYAFAQECIAQIRPEPLRMQLGQRLGARLPHGRQLEEA